MNRADRNIDHVLVREGLKIRLTVQNKRNQQRASYNIHSNRTYQRRLYNRSPTNRWNMSKLPKTYQKHMPRDLMSGWQTTRGERIEY